MSSQGYDWGSTGSSYQQFTTTDDSQDTVASAGVNVEAARLKYENPVRAQEFIEDLRHTVKDGFCQISTLQPTKAGGYIQLSADGANKFCTLGEMLGWAQGIVLEGGNQISHRCHNPACAIPGHVCSESPVENNARKGCLVWADCYHCDLKQLVCPHVPSCIKYAPGWEDWDQFVSQGTHQGL